MQKSAHNQVAASRTDEPRDPESGRTMMDDPDESGSGGESINFVRHPTWLLGTLLMGMGEVGNFAAFAFAPASLVAPLGAWSVVLSAVLAHLFLHEEISHRNLFGIILCVGGAFLIGTTGPDISSSEANLSATAVVSLLKRPPFVLFMLVVSSLTVLLMFLSHRTTLGRRFVFVYVGVSSLLGAVTVVCAKALSTFVKLFALGNSQFTTVLPVMLVIALAAAIVLQLKYLNMAMARFGNAEVVPVYYVLFTMCAMTSGVIMYREFDTLGKRNIPFFLGVIFTMSGVFLISRGEAPSREGASTKTIENGVARKGYERVPAPPSKVVQDSLTVTTKY